MLKDQVLHILAYEKLYGNLEKCHFFISYVMLLGYIMSSQGIQVDEDEVKVIRDWPTLPQFSRLEASMA